MRIIEMMPYIMGERNSREAAEPYRIERDLYDEIAQMVDDSMTAGSNLTLYEQPKQFYESEPDISYYVPRNAKEEIFFALKNGYASEEVPAKFIYMLNKAYSIHRMPNLLFKQISDADATIFLQKDYLGGDLSVYDVICSLIDSSYIPLSPTVKTCRHEDYSEVYIAETDMVAALPNCIVQNLTMKDISNIHVTDEGLKIGNVPLRSMGELYGAARSIYDLRDCI